MRKNVLALGAYSGLGTLSRTYMSHYDPQREKMLHHVSLVQHSSRVLEQINKEEYEAPLYFFIC